jgi:hypothetical protein
MKRGILKTIMVMCSAVIMFTVSAQQTNPVEDEYFTIQIKALSKKVPLTFFEDLTGVWVVQNTDGLFKYYYKKFPSYQDAKAETEEIRVKGYPDAFVVSSRKIFPAQSFKTPDVVVETPVVEKPVVKSESTEQKTVIEVVQTPKVETPGTMTVYTIQLSAFKYPVYIDFFAPITDISEFQLEDKLFRYCTGKYLSHDEAKLALDKYQKMGYDKSFIVEYDKYKPYIID